VCRDTSRYRLSRWAWAAQHGQQQGSKIKKETRTTTNQPTSLWVWLVAGADLLLREKKKYRWLVCSERKRYRLAGQW
jgi:hypothetical protein